jgi:hypothetical protein
MMGFVAPFLVEAAELDLVAGFALDPGLDFPSAVVMLPTVAIASAVVAAMNSTWSLVRGIVGLARTIDSYLHPSCNNERSATN